MTPAQLRLATGCSECASVAFANPLTVAIRRWEIRHVAAFLGQVAVESAKLSRLEENLNYTKPERLMAVWPRRFTTVESALPYVKNAEALANLVYGGRMGNTLHGEGWKYRGRGLKQLTGKDNYAAYQDSTGVQVLDKPELLLSPAYAADSAGWFWHQNKCDAIADDVEALTRRINGGLTGLQERIKLTELARGALA